MLQKLLWECCRIAETALGNAPVVVTRKQYLHNLNLDFAISLPI